MTKKLKIVYFGNETLASGVTTDAPILQSLLKSEHNVCSIVVHETTSKSRSYKKPAVIELAEGEKIPVHNPGNLRDIADEIKAYRADIGVLAAYGKIVPDEIIDLFPHGIVNIHPSLLPRYRGSTPIEQALLDAEWHTGVSLMSLFRELDAGPVYAQETVAFTPETTKQELTDILAKAGADLLSKHLLSIVDGSLKPTQQDNEYATFTSLLTKSNTWLDFNKPAQRLVREIVAYAGWPKSRCKLSENLEVIIHKARVVEATLHPGAINYSGDHLCIGAADRALEVLSLQPLGKKQITAQEFLRGYRHLLSENVIAAAKE